MKEKSVAAAKRAGLKGQAETLQTLMSELMEAAMEADGNPLADIELSPREIKTLMMLGERGEMIMTTLAAALRAPMSTVTRVADRLEKKALVERFRSEEDRRVVVVRQSAKGRMLRESIRRKQAEVAGRMLQRLTTAERQSLLALIGKLVGGVGDSKT